MSVIQIAPVETQSRVAPVQELFREYARSLGFHICLANFQKEVDQLGELPGHALAIFFALVPGTNLA